MITSMTHITKAVQHNLSSTGFSLLLVYATDAHQVYRYQRKMTFSKSDRDSSKNVNSDIMINENRHLRS